ncbi:MAG: FG-GAP-like repeat-containing protein [bacterium]
MPLLLLCVCSVLLAVPDAPARPLVDYLARRDYAGAVADYLSQVKGDSTNAVAMRNLARVYDHQHSYDSSLVWWERAAAADPQDDSAVAGRWLALLRRDQDDSLGLAATRALIAAEAKRYLAETTAASLTLAYDGLALSDTSRVKAAASLLTARFPDSPRGYELIGSMFYDSLYPVWNDDTLKLPIIRRFLERFPVTEWRQTFYQFMLSSLFTLKDTIGLRLAATEMTRDDTLDPFRYRYAAALFNRLGLDPAQSERYARRAVTLEPGALKPHNKPQEQWDIDYPPLYVSARVALAEAMMTQGRRAEAKGWLSDALAEFEWDPQQEATPASIYCLFGEVQTAEGDTATALTSFAYAMQCGDSRNTWTLRADSGFRRLLPLGDRSVIDTSRQILRHGGAIFTDVTDSAGLAGRRESRVAWGDYNNDRFEDLLLNGCRLLRNDSGAGFTDVSESVGLADADGRGGVWADYDNDGWLDLWMAAGSGLDRLWHNDRGRFTDATTTAGTPADSAPTEGAAWADFDGDGWVDLYCANYENWQAHTYYPDRLWRNRRGVFADATSAAGITRPNDTDLAGRGANWGDFDDDGDPDCFVSNYRLCENFLWENSGRSRFANRAAELGVSGDEVNGWYGHTIGSSWADYDNDGDLDLFTADLAHPRYIEFSNRSRLYENQGPGAIPRFRDRRAAVGIRYEETHSDPAWADIDNDGDLDLYVTSIYEGRRSFLYENQLLPNNGTFLGRRIRAFTDITWLSGTRCYNGWGCAFADFDNDGDQDLAVGSGSGVRLYRNDTRNGNHWLKVKVVGRRANRAGIGCRVTVRRGTETLVREVEGGKGTTSQNSLIQHFGLGHSTEPVTVTVRFGARSTVTLKGVKPDQAIVVRER